jgi:hypothetical protein
MFVAMPTVNFGERKLIILNGFIHDAERLPAGKPLCWEKIKKAESLKGAAQKHPDAVAFGLMSDRCGQPPSSAPVRMLVEPWSFC